MIDLGSIAGLHDDQQPALALLPLTAVGCDESAYPRRC
jgi:hypothetical protein